MCKRETKQPVVWIISTEQWPRALLRAELIEDGYDAVGYLTAEQTLEALRCPSAEKPGAVILDLNGQTLTSSLLSALQHKAVPVILLGGSVELSDPLVDEFHQAAILKRPFAIGDVVAVLKSLLPVPRRSRLQNPST